MYGYIFFSDFLCLIWYLLLSTCFIRFFDLDSLFKATIILCIQRTMRAPVFVVIYTFIENWASQNWENILDGFGLAEKNAESWKWKIKNKTVTHKFTLFPEIVFLFGNFPLLLMQWRNCIWAWKEGRKNHWNYDWFFVKYECGFGELNTTHIFQKFFVANST